jgi:hypothetical protein
MPFDPLKWDSHVHQVLDPIKDATGLDKVAHACNPSYSRGGDREDHSLRQTQAKSY